MKLGYARVSTDDQNLEMQIDALNGDGVEQIYSEKVSTQKDKDNRREFQKMLGYLRKGDTVVVFKLDRLGRSLKELLGIVEDFKVQGIHLRSLKENIDTSTATGTLIFHIFASLAEFERELIRERTRAGLESARARGRMGGRPRKSKDKIEMAIKMHESKQYTLLQIREATGIPATTLYDYLRAKEEGKG